LLRFVFHCRQSFDFPFELSCRQFSVLAGFLGQEPLPQSCLLWSCTSQAWPCFSAYSSTGSACPGADSLQVFCCPDPIYRFHFRFPKSGVDHCGSVALCLTLLLILCLSSLMDLTIAHMVLVHERTTLSLDVLVMAHVLIVVIVSRVGLFFLLEGHTLTLSRDT
jgi:hypothetical protein